MLNKELKEKMKEESVKMISLFVAIIILLKILFYRESVIVTLRAAVSLFWLFIMPGFGLLYYYHERLGFLERLIISIPLSGAIIGITSYYIGLAGLHARYHGIILPMAVLIAAAFLLSKTTYQTDR